MRTHALAVPICVGACLLLVGCGNRVNYLPRYETSAFPPSASVEVLFEPPSRSYTEIGLVTVESDDWSEERMIRKMRDRAREAGADAVLIRGMSIRKSEIGSAYSGGSFGHTSGSGWSSGSVMTSHEDVRRMEGLAIRYERER